MVNLTQATEWEKSDVINEDGPFLYGGGGAGIGEEKGKRRWCGMRRGKRGGEGEEENREEEGRERRREKE